MSQSELGQKQKLHVILDVINRILNLPELGSWTQQKWSVDSELLNLSPPVMTLVVCSLICLCFKVAYIANNVDPDQTAPLGAV